MLGLGHRLLQSLPPEQAEVLGVAGIQRLQPVLAPAPHSPGVDILETEKAPAGRVEEGAQDVDGHLHPAAPGQTLTPGLSYLCSSGTNTQTPSTAPHPPPPPTPVLLIHKLTSPNRPPLPVTKITIFKIHSRAFAYTRCTDWNLKGDMQNAVCAWRRALQRAGSEPPTPLLPPLSPCPPHTHAQGCLE